MRFSLLESWMLFGAVAAIFAISGAWFTVAPDWATEHWFPGVAAKAYASDPLFECNAKILGLSCLAVVSLYYIITKHAYLKGDGRTLFLIFGQVAVGMTIFLIMYGLFYKAHQPTEIKAVPVIVFLVWVVTLLFAALFAYRYATGQAPTQVQGAAPRSGRDIFTIVYLWVKPLGWLVIALWALFGTASYLRWSFPAFVGTTAEPLYDNEITVFVTRLWALHFAAFNGMICPGLLRADAATVRKFIVLATAILIALVWTYGDFIRRYPATSYLSGPGIIFAAFALDILSNLFALYSAGLGAAPGIPATAAPYSYA
eukprot:tig00020965_g16879.t1